MTPLQAVRELVTREIALLDMRIEQVREQLEKEQSALAAAEDRVADLARLAVDMRQRRVRLARFSEEGADDGKEL